MKYLPTIVVLLLMLSVGMSLRPRQMWEIWGRLTPWAWARLLGATFVLPPLLALVVGLLLPLDGSATAGLFLVGCVPGAPLMIHGVRRRGFDMQIAACYQVWSALLIPLIVPLLVMGLGWYYGRDIWIPPMKLLGVIAQQVFLPLLGGMVLAYFLADRTAGVQRVLTRVGNALLLVAFVAILYQLRVDLEKVTLWLALAAPLLAAGCLFAVRFLLPEARSATVQTLSLCNMNRHVGLALLLSGQQIYDQRLIPAIAAYALAALLVMTLYAKFARRDSEPVMA